MGKVDAETENYGKKSNDKYYMFVNLGELNGEYVSLDETLKNTKKIKLPIKDFSGIVIDQIELDYEPKFKEIFQIQSEDIGLFINGNIDSSPFYIEEYEENLQKNEIILINLSKNKNIRVEFYIFKNNQISSEYPKYKRYYNGSLEKERTLEERILRNSRPELFSGELFYLDIINIQNRKQ